MILGFVGLNSGAAKGSCDRHIASWRYVKCVKWEILDLDCTLFINFCGSSSTHVLSAVTALQKAGSCFPLQVWESVWT